MAGNRTKTIQTVLTFDKSRDPQNIIAKLSQIEQLIVALLVEHGPFKPAAGLKTDTSLGFVSDKAHLTVTVVPQPLDLAGFVDVFANPLIMNGQPGLCQAVQDHGHAILIEVGAGSVPGFASTLKDLFPEIVNDLDFDNGKMGIVSTQDQLEARLSIAQIVTSTLSQALKPSAVHWAQSQQLFSADTFIERAKGDFDLLLYTGPFLFGAEEMPDGQVKVGIRALGSKDLIGKMVSFKPSVQDWTESYTQMLGFIGYCRSLGRILGENETMASDAPGAPRIRVNYKDDIPQLPEGYIELSLDDRTQEERGPVLTETANESDLRSAMAGALDRLNGQKSRRSKGFISRILGR